MILELHKQGVPIAAIARQMNMDRKTVRKYIEQGLQAPMYGPREPRPCKIDGFRDYLKERIVAFPGLSAVRLCREIGELGYKGGLTQIKDFLRSVRPRPPRSFEHRFETLTSFRGFARVNM